jgi:hypothetical protein
MDNTRNILETLVWGKPTKRGFSYGLSREFTEAENQKYLIDISSTISSFSKKTTQQTRPAFSAPVFSTMKNRPPEIYCMWLEFGLSLLPDMVMVSLHWLPKSGP